LRRRLDLPDPTRQVDGASRIGHGSSARSTRPCRLHSESRHAAKPKVGALSPPPPVRRRPSRPDGRCSRATAPNFPELNPRGRDLHRPISEFERCKNARVPLPMVPVDAEGHLDRGAIPMVFGIVSNSLMEITIYCKFTSFRMLPHVCPQSCRERSAAVSAPQAP
jgi:hypothetical protein